MEEQEDRCQWKKFSNVRRCMSAEAIMCSSETSTLPPTRYGGARQRKLSYPTSLHATTINPKFLLDGIPTNSHHLGVIGNRRRFSTVSDVVTRKLSTTIGWRVPAIPTQEIVAQGKTLCCQYIRCRLKRSGVFSKKCGLQRLRSAVSLPEGIIIREVFPHLLSIGIELERMHPKLYTGVTRQVSNGKFSSRIIVAEKSLRSMLLGVSRSLFQMDISWAKIISLYAIAGGLATDCVRQNHPEFTVHIVETIGEIIEDELAPWIHSEGGWVALQMYCIPNGSQVPFRRLSIYFGSILLTIILFISICKWFGKITFIL